jgi:hypothetical protein
MKRKRGILFSVPCEQFWSGWLLVIDNRSKHVYSKSFGSGVCSDGDFFTWSFHLFSGRKSFSANKIRYPVNKSLNFPIDVWMSESNWLEPHHQQCITPCVGSFAYPDIDIHVQGMRKSKQSEMFVGPWWVSNPRCSNHMSRHLNVTRPRHPSPSLRWYCINPVTV